MQNWSNATRSIVAGGLIAGIMDLTAASIFYGVLRGRSPIVIFQSISSGLFGAKAYEGGVPTAVLGVALHFLIAFTATAIFYLLSRRFPVLLKYAIPAGILYGVAVYFFMSQIVLPLSAFPHRTVVAITGIIIHIFCVGLPIALATRKFSTSPVYPSPV
jgi:hypothetical protein